MNEQDEKLLNLLGRIFVELGLDKDYTLMVEKKSEGKSKILQYFKIKSQ